MKRFLICLMSLICVFSLLTFSGCADEFSGNYQETTKEEVELFATELEESDSNKSIELANGVRVYLDLDLNIQMGEDESLKTSGDVDFKFGKVGDDLKMCGKINLSVMGLKTKVNAYYTDGYFYTSTKFLGYYFKEKSAMAIEELIGNNFDEYTTDFGINFEDISLQELLEACESELDAKYYIEKTETNTKIKVSFTTDIDGDAVDVEAYLVYDVDNNISCVRVVAQSDDIGKVSLSITSYSGEIETPDNPEDYEDTTNYYEDEEHDML